MAGLQITSSPYVKPSINLTPEQLADYQRRKAAGTVGQPMGTTSGAALGGVQPSVQTAVQPGGQTPQQTPVDWQALQQLTQAGLNPQQIQTLAANRMGQPVPSGTSGFTTTNPTMQQGAPQYGLSGAEDALQRGLTGGLAGISAGVDQATQTLSPYTQGGGQAYNLQAALSGALGPEAQKQAFQNYQESPEQQYLRDRSEQAILRNSAATGGLGGGNVQRALQENAIGLASQDYANSFNRLGSLSQMGQQSSNLLGGIQANAGGQAGQMAYGTGGQMANYRTRAGEQIAGNVQDTSQGLANMINQQGNDLSSIIGQGGNQLSQLLASYGINASTSSQDLAKILANIATGSASQVAGLSPLPGVNDTGILGGLGNLLSGAGNFATGMGWGK